MDYKCLKDKLVLVTGGGSGIGKETCKLAAIYGATIIVTDLNKATAEETKNEIEKENEGPLTNHTAFQIDIVDKKSVEQLSVGIVDHYGRPPSIVIHCADIFGHPDESDNYSEESWQMVIDVNLKGTFLIDSTFAKLMKDNGIEGSVVNVSSIFKDGSASSGPYSASKAGVSGVTKSIAQEFGSFNIRCNAVAPGAIDTPMLREVPDNFVNKFLETCALKRVGHPAEIASICVFLGSDASSYINGVVIEADGGKLVC